MLQPAPYVRRARPRLPAAARQTVPPAKGPLRQAQAPLPMGSMPEAAKSVRAGSSRLHTLAASMMPAAMPHRMRCVQGRDCRRSKNTPAAPSVVHAAGNSSTHAVKTIWFTIHSPFARCMCDEAKRCRKARHTKYSVTGFSVRMRLHLFRCQRADP